MVVRRYNCGVKKLVARPGGCWKRSFPPPAHPPPPVVFHRIINTRTKKRYLESKEFIIKERAESERGSALIGFLQDCFFFFNLSKRSHEIRFLSNQKRK